MSNRMVVCVRTMRFSRSSERSCTSRYCYLLLVPNVKLCCKCSLLHWARDGEPLRDDPLEVFGFGSLSSICILDAGGSSGDPGRKSYIPQLRAARVVVGR